MGGVCKIEDYVRHLNGRQYHLGVSRGEVADRVLLVGDPARAEIAASLLDEVEIDRRNRGYVVLTGTYRGLRVSVVSTGIGSGAMEIAVIELCQCTERPSMIRCGSCSALQPDIRPGDLVISSAAYRLESTSLQFVGEGYPAVSDAEALLCLVQAADDVQAAYHVGITATVSGFYGAQGRELPGFPLRSPHGVRDLQRQGIKNLEMEISPLFALATLQGFRAGAVCVVFGNRCDDTLVPLADKETVERRCVEVGLRALENLADLDRERGGRRHWHPGLARTYVKAEEAGGSCVESDSPEYFKRVRLSHFGGSAGG
jgi:uridine phosphorylase